MATQLPLPPVAMPLETSTKSPALAPIMVAVHAQSQPTSRAIVVAVTITGKTDLVTPAKQNVDANQAVVVVWEEGDAEEEVLKVLRVVGVVDPGRTRSGGMSSPPTR